MWRCRVDRNPPLQEDVPFGFGHLSEFSVEESLGQRDIPGICLGYRNIPPMAWLLCWIASRLLRASELTLLLLNCILSQDFATFYSFLWCNYSCFRSLMFPKTHVMECSWFLPIGVFGHVGESPGKRCHVSRNPIWNNYNDLGSPRHWSDSYNLWHLTV